VVAYRGQTGNISRRDPTCYLKHLNPRIDRIVCVSEAVRESLLPHVSDPRKLVTIYKGHDLAWYAGTQPANRDSLGVPDDAFLITCVANHRPRKGVSVLIDAAALLPGDSPIHFVLAGRNMTGEDVRRKVDKLPLAANFHLFDHRDDVLEIVAASDATVLPATKREGLPKTVIESMAQAVVPVVTATGGSPELVVDGETGFVVPPGDPAALADAMLRLLRDRGHARRMGLAARQRLKTRFRVEDSVTAHERLFNELADG
jgi:glycosyltransferase involved in cell wall biosynthesis